MNLIKFNIRKRHSRLIIENTIPNTPNFESFVSDHKNVNSSIKEPDSEVIKNELNRIVKFFDKSRLKIYNFNDKRLVDTHILKKIFPVIKEKNFVNPQRSFINTKVIKINDKGISEDPFSNKKELPESDNVILTPVVTENIQNKASSVITNTKETSSSKLVNSNTKFAELLSFWETKK